MSSRMIHCNSCGAVVVDVVVLIVVGFWASVEWLYFGD